MGSNSLILLFSVFLMIQIPSLGQQGWFQQESGTDLQLNSVFFLDSLKGWIVGEDSTILKTSNGGEDWISLQSGFNYDYNDIHFSSDSVGWLVGEKGFYEGVLLNTSNAGQTWLKHTDSTMRNLYAISFVNEKVGYVSGGVGWPGAGIILKTENEGLSWDTVYITNYQNNDNFYDIDFVNQDVGWVVGGIACCWGNIIKKTTDAGKNWMTQLEDGYELFSFSSCDFVSEEKGWVTFDYYDVIFSNSLNILFTQDGGNTWTIQYLPDTLDGYSLKSIFFINEEKGWCVGDKWLSDIPDIFYTSDAGNTWNQQLVSAEQNSILNSVYFINEEIGWAVGDSGLILHTRSGGVSFVEEEEIDKIPNEYLLSNNYPNPFNPSTRIKYSITQTSQVQIKVFDVLGNEIETLIDKERSAGTYEISWYAEGLPSGVYFYQVKAGSFVETKKMLLLK